MLILGGFKSANEKKNMNSQRKSKDSVNNVKKKRDKVKTRKSNNKKKISKPSQQTKQIKLYSLKDKNIPINNKKQNIRKTKKKKARDTSGFLKNPKYRKLRATLFYSMVILSIISIVLIFSSIFLFKIDNIYIFGESNYSKEEIIKSSGLTKGETLIFCNKEEIQKNIKDNLPYVEEVRVNKSFPNSIEIIIIQAVPSAQIEINNKFIIINKGSRVLEISDARSNQVALLIGSNPISYELSKTIEYQNPDTQRIIDEIITDFYEVGINPITQINLTDSFNNLVVYDNRITIELGKPVDIKYKASMSATVINSPSVTNVNKGTLDVSLALEDNKTYFKPDYS